MSMTVPVAGRSGGTRFVGKVALVTGGGRGIGKAICLGFAREGAHVAVLDLDLAAAQTTAGEVEALGRRGFAGQADVTDADRVAAVVTAAIAALGQLDVLVNNAGGSARGKMSDFVDSEPSTWDEVIGRNLRGTLTVTRAVLPHLIGRDDAKVVNIGSGTGVSGSPRQVDYSAAKAGVIGFTKALAKELGQHGINV